MPIYKGSNEVSSGNLKKGSTDIEEGYKETNQFYVNTNTIIINFVDAISGATMDTTQFSSTGTPGSSFASFTRTVTADSGRVFQGSVTVNETGDTGGNVTASISGQGSTTATLNVSGTYPAASVTVTLTVNGATQADPPNLIVSISSPTTAHTTVSTEDGSNLGSVTLTPSGSNCTNGSTTPVTYNFGNVSSGTYYSFTGCNSPACQVTATFSVSASKAGYDSGSGSASETGAYPQIAVQCSDSNLGLPRGCNNSKGAVYNGVTNTIGVTAVNYGPSGWGSGSVTAADCAGNWPAGTWTDTTASCLYTLDDNAGAGNTTGNMLCTGSSGNTNGTYVNNNYDCGSVYNATPGNTVGVC